MSTTPYLDALLAQALRIAKAAVISDVECHGQAVRLQGGQLWYDVGALLDPNEQPEPCIDMAREALAFGFAVGAISQHPQQSHLVRVHHPSCMQASQAGAVQR